MRLLKDCDNVLGAVRRSGGCEAQDFMQGIDRRYQARYQRYLEYLRDGIAIKSPENFRRLSPAGSDPTVFEIKVDKYRMYVVRSKSIWFATHGREKPKDNQVQHEIDKALSIFWEGNGERR